MGVVDLMDDSRFYIQKLDTVASNNNLPVVSQTEVDKTELYL